MSGESLINARRRKTLLPRGYHHRERSCISVRPELAEGGAMGWRKILEAEHRLMLDVAGAAETGVLVPARVRLKKIGPRDDEA
jgi:hypothetical protein